MCLFSIDAAIEDGSFGRLVNDDHIHPNCRMKKVVADGKPHLCLFAVRDIIPGEEITYDYGGTDWPWREKVSQISFQNTVEDYRCKFKVAELIKSKLCSTSH